MFKWVSKRTKKQHKLSKLEELFLREFNKGVKEVDAYYGLYEVGELRVYVGRTAVSVSHDSWYLGELTSEYGDKLRDFVRNEREQKREERIQKLLEGKNDQLDS